VLACPNPTIDPKTKLTSCSNGLRHRAQPTTCSYTNPPPLNDGGAGGEAGAAGAPGSVGCFTDADCRSVLRGYCDNTDQVEPQCRSGCLTDSDCDGGVCACNGIDSGRCTYAECRTDADCGTDGYCAPEPGICGPDTFHCITLKDECATTADCKLVGGVCQLQNGRHVCQGNAVCGRPFLIADAPRLAAIAARADWLDATLAPELGDLTPVQRAQLAAHWARLGQMEHASIAAFARFNLQLLSLGAPSDLIEACNRALTDETAHARLCFSLASAYGATAVGPAALDIGRCFEENDLLSIAKLVLREGCVGETVASLEAIAAAEAACDPVVVRALTRIARDELNHAQLAFEFLRWALTQSSAEVRQELENEANEQLARFESEVLNGSRNQTDAALAQHGLLDGDALRTIHLAAARDVARPLLAALFGVGVSGAA